MRKQIGRLLWVVAFGSLYATAVCYIGNAKVSLVAGATAMAGEEEWQCGRRATVDAVNVRCPPYDVVPDDDRDDSMAFQRAVDNLPASGGKIFIPAGTYLLDKPLVIQKSLVLEGAGAATILTHRYDLSTEGGANVIRIGGGSTVTENVTLREFTLQGPQGKDLRTSMVRIVNNVKGVTLRDLTFSHVTSTCILIFGTNIQNIDISDNRADEFYEQFVELASGGISDVRIERNTVKSTRAHPKLGSTEPFGILFEPKISGEIANVSIVGNRISFERMNKTDLINTGGISLGEGNPPPYLFRNILVQENEIRSVGVGIRVQTLRAGPVRGPGSVVITKNYVEDAENYGIQVKPASDNAHRDMVSITGNTVRGYSSRAFYRYDGIRLEGFATGPEIIGNQILPFRTGTADRGRFGISIEPGIKTPLIRDNKIGGYRDGAISNKSSNEKIDK